MTKPNAQDEVVKAMLQSSQEQFWQPVLDILGINDDEAARLVRLLMLHLIIDRGVTIVLSIKLSKALSSSAEKVEAEIARLSLDKRIDLAIALNVITASCAADIKAVNVVRNKFAHYNPKNGLNLKVDELASPHAFERCVERGRRAIDSIVILEAR